MQDNATGKSTGDIIKIRDAHKSNYVRNVFEHLTKYPDE